MPLVSDKRAFTLIEVTVALALVLVVVSGLPPTVLRMLQTSYSNHANLIMTTSGQECIELLRARRDRNWQTGTGASYNGGFISGSTTTYSTIDYDGTITGAPDSPNSNVSSTPYAPLEYVGSGSSEFIRHVTTTPGGTELIPSTNILITATPLGGGTTPTSTRATCQVLWTNRQYSGNFSFFVDLYQAKPGT